MGRRSHSQTLHLWANGDSELQYDASWQSSRLGRPISLSLPFNLRNEPLKGASVANYFEGLLPDSDIIRKRVATRFKTGSLEQFELLAAIGGDRVGALQLLPEAGKPEGLAQVGRNNGGDCTQLGNGTSGRGSERNPSSRSDKACVSSKRTG